MMRVRYKTEKKKIHRLSYLFKTKFQQLLRTCIELYTCNPFIDRLYIICARVYVGIYTIFRGYVLYEISAEIVKITLYFNIHDVPFYIAQHQSHIC